MNMWRSGGASGTSAPGRAPGRATDGVTGKRGRGGDEPLRTAPMLLDPITDPQRLAQRQKQIDYGKNTLGYERYAREVKRRSRDVSDPWTPDISESISKRHFDGKVKAWRRALHEWENAHPLAARGEASADAPEAGGETAASGIGVAGLARCAGGFDDFLDDILGADDEPDGGGDDRARDPAPPLDDPAAGRLEAAAATATIATACDARASCDDKLVAGRPTPTAADDTSNDRAKMRRLLDEYKKQPSASAPSPSIFGRLEDGAHLVG